MKNVFLFSFITLFVFIFSCSKDPGIGGESSISGKVLKVEYTTKYSTTIDTVAALDEDVFIVYGDTSNTGFYDDKAKTGYDGTFEFKYLKKGKYIIYTTSKDTTSSDQKISVFKKVELKSNNDKVNVGEFITYDGGLASISGKLYAIDYYNANYQPKSPPYIPFPDAEDRVYISFENSLAYFNNMRAGNDGGYLFTGLIPGKYVVFAYTKDATQVSKVNIIADTITIDTYNQQKVAVLHNYSLLSDVNTVLK